MGDWSKILESVFTVVIIPLLGALTCYLISWIRVKSAEIREKTENEKLNKYMSYLEEAICNAVMATNQTYVDALKTEGKFDADAQKKAFKKTYEAVMSILTDEAKQHIGEAVGDIKEFITNKIEANVAINK